MQRFPELMEKYKGWRCAACGEELVPVATQLAYLGSVFDVELPGCPRCGQVLVFRGAGPGQDARGRADPRGQVMREAGAAPFYRRGELRAVTGETLRPGGTDLTERAFNLAGLTPGARLLDLGCGPGASLTLARERFCAKPVGLDFSAAMLAEAKARRPGLRLVRADALALPFRAASFEVVLCECVLSLLPDPAPVLADIARCLAPGGRLVWADLCRREVPPAPGSGRGRRRLLPGRGAGPSPGAGPGRGRRPACPRPRRPLQSPGRAGRPARLRRHPAGRALRGRARRLCGPARLLPDDRRQGGRMSDDLATDILRLAHAGYCCSQILMRLALDLQGRDDPDLGAGHGRALPGTVPGQPDLRRADRRGLRPRALCRQGG